MRRCFRWCRDDAWMTIARRCCAWIMARQGTLLASQIAAGEGNGLRLRVYGETGSLDWRQEDPNRLRVKWLDGPEEIRHAAGGYLSEDARAVTRLPGGHPEGYLEAFAVLYREFAERTAGMEGVARAIRCPPTLPGIAAGVRGMRFIDRAIESSKREELDRVLRMRCISGAKRMKTIKGPGIFLAQFADNRSAVQYSRGNGDMGGEAGLRWRADSHVGQRVLFDLKTAAESQDYCDEMLWHAARGWRRSSPSFRRICRGSLSRATRLTTCCSRVSRLLRIGGQCRRHGRSGPCSSWSGRQRQARILDSLRMQRSLARWRGRFSIRGRSGPRDSSTKHFRNWGGAGRPILDAFR